jgi:hypothetical protein
VKQRDHLAHYMTRSRSPRRNGWRGNGSRRLVPMIRIAITAEAFEAIVATLPLGSVGFEPEGNMKSEQLIWLEARVLDSSRRLARARRELQRRHLSAGGAECNVAALAAAMSVGKGRSKCVVVSDPIASNDTADISPVRSFR